MPAPGQHRSYNRRETFPEIAERIGEDPAVFLDRPLLDDEDAKQKLFARIRGIDRHETILAFIEVETALERGPRKSVIARLNERKQTLDEIGERPDRLTFGPRQSFDEWDNGNAADGGELTAKEKLDKRRRNRAEQEGGVA